MWGVRGPSGQSLWTTQVQVIKAYSKNAFSFKEQNIQLKEGREREAGRKGERKVERKVEEKKGERE